ncbi:hypothetical protein MLP_01340 [Microlunatus phosphovorus NM-1]|uniref:Uncharacterized protein n=1 Tax=Microlunatus phosphovorus (strain ATCC 700054 / DSM 10555 / JCM 9379 / NBRC 101784 / NCIMB 13414 / VKM Ac-1990 / NM-1) TaxID=1032480 RepID=F5XHK3_MICPN|nr:hypothetical protein [Microlunatus phosphovorus]BAK33148.1 hypothetical protein MLP_01340 [Microlunatus phosphovorus NM-1]
MNPADLTRLATLVHADDLLLLAFVLSGAGIGFAEKAQSSAVAYALRRACAATGSVCSGWSRPPGIWVRPW